MIDRGSTQQPARAFSGVAVALAVAATLIVAVCAVNTLSRINRPFPGFFVWANLFVPAVGEPSWTGVEAGLRYQSWVISADGLPVSHARDLERVLESRRVGDIVPYELARDGQVYSIRVPIMNLDPHAWTAVLGIYVFDAIVLLVLGIVVLYLKPQDAAARAMFYFATNLSLYMATSADLFGPYLFRIPYFFFVNLIPASVCYLLSRFPVERARAPLEDRLLIALAAVGLGLGAATNAAFHSSRSALVTLDRATHGLLAAAGLGAIVFFCWHFFRAASPLDRQRTKVVLLGTLGAFTPPVVVLSFMYGLGVPVPLNFVTLTFVLFPIGIGYAIARHDLFDIDRVIRRTLAYVVLSAVVFGVYSLTIGAIDFFLENRTHLGSRVAEGLLILALILITSPSRDRVQNFVDRVYDRHRYNYRDVVRSTSRTFATILDFEKLVSEALTLIDGTLQPVGAAIYRLGSDGTPLEHGRLQHEPAQPRRVEARLNGEPAPRIHAVAERLRVRPTIGTGDRGAGEQRERDMETLETVGAAFAVSMTLEGGLVGFLVVGPKRSGAHYTSDDHELARTMCDQLAVALENAQAYKTIDVLNVDLEAKNIALQTANRELRDAQDELVQKERLAAVGELSGAVAHAIRNPLAGIKAAAQLASLDLDGHPAAESLHDVIAESDRLDQRIGALLQFTRPFEPMVRPAMLGPIVSEAVRDTAAKAAERKVTVTVTEDPGLEELQVDPVLIEQAVVELVSNAIDASPEGGTVEVRFGADREGGGAFVQVLDSGCGINERAAERLYELFYTTKSKGTGFGLATVKKIVERHGGRVEATNREGGGASFRICFPA